MLAEAPFPAQFASIVLGPGSLPVVNKIPDAEVLQPAALFPVKSRARVGALSMMNHKDALAKQTQPYMIGPRRKRCHHASTASKTMQCFPAPEVWSAHCTREAQKLTWLQDKMHDGSITGAIHDLDLQTSVLQLHKRVPMCTLMTRESPRQGHIHCFMQAQPTTASEVRSPIEKVNRVRQSRVDFCTPTHTVMETTCGKDSTTTS